MGSHVELWKCRPSGEECGDEEEEPPEKVQMLDVPVNLAMLKNNAWTAINWPTTAIHNRRAPDFTLTGQPLQLMSTEAHCIIQPLDLWLILTDKRGHQWGVALECRDGYVWARLIQEPTGCNEQVQEADNDSKRP